MMVNRVVQTQPRRVRISLLLLCASMASWVFSNAYAQGQRQEPPDSGRVKLGETDLYPTLRLEYGVNDNAFLESSNEEETSRVTVQPGVVWFASQRTTTLRMEYQGEFSQHSVSELDVQNHALDFQVRTELGRQWRAQTSGSFERRSFELGADRTSGNAREAGEPFQFNDFTLAAVGTFGAQGARGNLDFGIRTRQLDPKNLLESSDDFGYTRISPFLLFSFRLSQDTRLTFETRFSDFDYELDTRDRTETAFLIGARFAATGRLTGSFDLGVSSAEFDTQGIEASDNVIASAQIGYELTEAAVFTLSGQRSIENATVFDESEGDNDRLRNTVRLQWNQQFTARVAHEAFVRSQVLDRTCPFRGFGDTEFGYQLGVSVRRWIEVGGFFRNRGREFDTCDAGTDSDLDYDSQRIGVFVNMTL